MNPTRRALQTLVAAALLVSASSWAEPGPYDETADAAQQIAQAQARAGAARQSVLVVFGANWCGDCKVLDQTFRQDRTAALLAQRYQVVKVDVGRFNRNTGIAAAYGVPLKKGIPAVAVLSPTGQLIYATQAGELADARAMGEPGIHDFLDKLSAPGR